jgi:hypothetical protein
MTDTEKYMMTAPDLDHSTRFKLMAVDLDPEAIEHIKERLLQVSFGVTLFIQDSEPGDWAWAISAARTSDATLVNMRPGPNDLLKGFLLSLDHTTAYGQSVPMARKTYYDLDLWLTDALMSRATLSDNKIDN